MSIEILVLADTTTKREILVSAMRLQLANLKCQLRRTETGFNDKVIRVDKNHDTAVARLKKKIAACEQMLEIIREEVFV